jgi:hypothetical protein
MKTKSISQVRNEARKEFVKFFGVEVKEKVRAFSSAGMFVGVLGAFLGLSSLKGKELLYSEIVFNAIFLISLIVFLVARKSLVQVRRIMREFKGVNNAKTMFHFLVREENKNFRDIPFFSQELTRLIMNKEGNQFFFQEHNIFFFQEHHMSILNNIFSYLEKKGLEFKFERIFFNAVFEFNYNTFHPMSIIVLGDKEKANNMAQVLRKDYYFKNQKEPLFARFIDFVFGEDEITGMNFKIEESLKDVNSSQTIILEFPEFYK